MGKLAVYCGRIKWLAILLGIIFLAVSFYNTSPKLAEENLSFMGGLEAEKYHYITTIDSLKDQIESLDAAIDERPGEFLAIQDSIKLFRKALHAASDSLATVEVKRQAVIQKLGVKDQNPFEQLRVDFGLKGSLSGMMALTYLAKAGSIKRARQANVKRFLILGILAFGAFGLCWWLEKRYPSQNADEVAP